jgi:glutamate racemase
MKGRPGPRAPIGVFDSGVGGLTVLRALRALLPGEDFIYVGDTARVPYGSKSPETVRRFALEIAGLLKRKGVKMIVAACNTVSAVALPELRRFFPFPGPVQGVIEPGAAAARRATRTGRVGVIGTEATVKSGAYEKALRRLDRRLSVFSRACPLFVPLVEEGWTDHPVAGAVARECLAPLLAKRVDALVLGCTHYPLLKPVLRRVAGRARLIDSAEETARVVRDRLQQDGALARGGRKGTVAYFSSDDPVKFARLGRRFLGWRLGNVKRIHLDGA